MLPAAIIAGVIIVTLGSVIKRLLDLNHVPLLVWPTLVLVAAAPAYVGYAVLNPGPAVDHAVVRAEKDSVTLNVPEDYAIMVTAVLADDVDESEPNAGKTAYAFNIKGDGWAQTEAGSIHSKSAGGGPDIDLVEGNGITESGKKRAGKWGENLQDRIDLHGFGPVQVYVSNWQGQAAESLSLDVVPGPPGSGTLWALIAVVTGLGIWLEVKHGVDRVTGDLSFLVLWAVFLRDGVTPLDDFQRIGWAVAPAALLGWGVAGGLAWLSVKYVNSKAAAEERAAEEAEAAAKAAAEEAASHRTRRRRNRPPQD